jgi:3'(2'), 5'-bisphosphate nucleotidase
VIFVDYPFHGQTQKGVKMFEKELEIGQHAVIEAMRMTRTVQDELAGKDAITKADKSPVTIADFAAQAVVCKTLNDHFPDIPIVAEERSDALKKPEHREILDKIFYFIDNDAKIKEILDQDNLLPSIDLGGDEPGNGVFWTLDPVDGTKGFLRGQQFAIALALIVEGNVRAGILGCPRLSIPPYQSTQGFLFYAVKGEGTRLLNVETGETRDVHVSEITDPFKMRFVESYVSAHSNQDKQMYIARMLKTEKEPVRMDSQVKYGVLATGNAEIYLRIPNPKTPDYREKIWDHAAGSLVVEEAGGVVTDILGKKLDFSAGKTLKNNRGVFASVPVVHNLIIELLEEMA